MIGYTTVGTNDLEAAKKFYDELFAVLGAKRLLEVRGVVVFDTFVVIHTLHQIIVGMTLACVCVYMYILPGGYWRCAVHRIQFI